MKNKKMIFFPGLGERAKDYKHISKYIDVYNIDWNNIKLPRNKQRKDLITLELEIYKSISNLPLSLKNLFEIFLTL